MIGNVYGFCLIKHFDKKNHFSECLVLYYKLYTMSKKKQYTITLLAKGKILEDLHYGMAVTYKKAT